jgi:formamidopyrimidine-DNA glycosylase
VPELPDLAVVADALHAALAGRPIVRADALAPLAVRGTPDELAALIGLEVASVRRRGKFLLIDLPPDRVVVNPMLTGRFQLASPAVRRPSRTAVVFGFGARAVGPPIDAAAWTAGAPWLAPNEAEVEVRYRDPTQMGKVYLLPAGAARTVPGLDDELGPDADDPALTADEWRRRMRRHPGELKNLLKKQAFVAGVGNAYSDEILHAAGILPFRKRSTLAAEEVDALYLSMRSTLDSAIAILRERVPPTFETQVRDFLAVHAKGGSPCPKCGTRISEVRPGGFVTSFCRSCQR